MHTMLTDETNRQPTPDSRFFAYGGLIVPMDQLESLDTEIAAIRARAGYTPTDEFKFDTRTRPQQVPQEMCVDAKKSVIDVCLRVGCRFIVHIILHDIIRNQDLDKQVESAADYVIGRYNMYLHDVQSCGLCIVDNLPVQHQFRYLSSKFTTGLTLEGGRVVPLDRIRLFAASCSNASHLSSAMDIVLGSFRYCINNPRNVDAARSMIGKVADLMWGEKVGGNYNVIGKGLIIRPEIDSIRSPAFKIEYQNLIANINHLLQDVPAA